MPDRIWIWFADNGNIRKWQREPFEEGTEFVSTITPAEVGGLWVPANPEHAKLGWSYDFEQTERIARAAYDSTGYDATMEVVEFVMAEADRRHRDALAAKDAELAAVKEKYQREMDYECKRTNRAETRLGNILARIHRDGGQYQAAHGTDKACEVAENLVASTYVQRDEARKALEEIYKEARSLPLHTSAVTREHVLTSKLAVIRDAARRALEAQGGENAE